MMSVHHLKSFDPKPAISNCFLGSKRKTKALWGVLLVLILRAKMKYEVSMLPFSIVVVVYFWTSSFVVRTSKIHIALVPSDKWIEKKVSCPAPIRTTKRVRISRTAKNRNCLLNCFISRLSLFDIERCNSQLKPLRNINVPACLGCLLMSKLINYTILHFNHHICI